MEIALERGDELGREARTIAGGLYNKINLVFAKLGEEYLFVPIRSMQYLARISEKEVVFIDAQRPHRIQLAWSDFRPQQRDDLRAPVSFQCIYYDESGHEIMQRLHSEFLKALTLVEERLPGSEGGEATVMPFTKR